MSSSKKKEIIAISSDSSESDFDARPWPWEDYFPKEFKASDYFGPAKRGEPSSNLTSKEEQKMAFKARVQDNANGGSIETHN
ncbi:hypothetical protein CTI12_AA418630 [Artemisia annua]|uniref:Uncharacterized protein n=1 Tax=Artemisia annua TaxID=35608 RepID=A0A2U1M5D8_ARTAN|nr:hypothetical protein CTI12_AA418630 [Artemisia annua]